MTIENAKPMTDEELRWFYAGVALYAPKPDKPPVDNDWYNFYFRDVPRLLATIEKFRKENA